VTERSWHEDVDDDDGDATVAAAGTSLQQGLLTP